MGVAAWYRLYSNGKTMGVASQGEFPEINAASSSFDYLGINDRQPDHGISTRGQEGSASQYPEPIFNTPEHLAPTRAISIRMRK